VSEGDVERNQPSGPGLPLCPNCLAENDPAADFCQHCGCPLTPMAATDPLRSAYAQGYWYRRAASGQIRPIVFWGTWLLFALPPLAAVAFLLPSLWQAEHFVALEWPHVCGIVFIGLYMLFLGILLWRMTRNYRRCRREEPQGTAALEEPDDDRPED
jgi:hypothetical protein